MKSLSLIICLILAVGYLTPVQAVTDAELEALEKQIEQQEAEEKKQAEADAKRRAEAGAKRKTEQKRKAEVEAEKKRFVELEKQRQEEQRRFTEEMRNQEEARLVELERQRQEEEAKKRAEEEKKEKHKLLIAEAEQAVRDKDYELATSKYNNALALYPSDQIVLDGIAEVKKLIDKEACLQVVGTWYFEPPGITWIIHEDNTVYGSWLIFDTTGNWECVSAKERKFVFSFPKCVVCATQYLTLSDDSNIFRSSHNGTPAGKRIFDSKKDTTPKRQIKL